MVNCHVCIWRSTYIRKNNVCKEGPNMPVVTTLPFFFAPLPKRCMYALYQKAIIWVMPFYSTIEKRKNLQNVAYPEIVFCYIAQKFTYFTLPHIVLYFIFHHGFFVGIVSQHAHKDAHLFRLYFFSVTYFVSYFVLTHKLIIIF
jgi:hypothetical protein